MVFKKKVKEEPVVASGLVPIAPLPASIAQQMAQHQVTQPEMPTEAWDLVEVPNNTVAFRNNVTGEVVDDRVVLLRILNILEQA